MLPLGIDFFWVEKIAPVELNSGGFDVPKPKEWNAGLSKVFSKDSRTLLKISYFFK